MPAKPNQFNGRRTIAKNATKRFPRWERFDLGVSPLPVPRHCFAAVGWAGKAGTVDIAVGEKVQQVLVGAQTQFSRSSAARLGPMPFKYSMEVYSDSIG